ncbi:hypothetical protein [Acidovorax sp.]|uniref:hypothetical protein n=1 Tax=Acidovorax sp. TaxID=1872122 RepID=UPI0025B8453A|nr:hypothetical protein [Acidovorax sp.]HQD15234.1 hypothetical protein [Ottowia sp.]
MMAADSLHVSVHLIVPSGVSIRWLCACRRACSASASALHFVLPSHVQASCLEHAWPAAIGVFPGALAARAAAAPGHHGRERMREAGVQGKIEGRGTTVRAKPVCTWGWRGTRQGAASCRQLLQCLDAISECACFARCGAMALDGATP